MKAKSSHQMFIQSFLYVLGSIFLSFLLVQLPQFHTIVASFGALGFAGAILGGMLFVSVFTAAPAILLLLVLAETHGLFLITIFAGIGAVIGDYIIISAFNRHGYASETIVPKEEQGIMKTIGYLRHSKYRFFLTILGAIIIASPLPDEIGLALMGLSNMKRSSFLLLTFVLNMIGIYLLLSVVK